jgi:flagellar biogenesis protein FliO
MLTQLALLPVLAVTVTGVTTQAQDDAITIEVATSEPIAAGRIRPMAGHRLLYLFVDDATPEQEVFRGGGRTVTARARSRYTKLEIPLTAGQRCYEPAEVRATASGVSVQFSCSNKPGAPAAEAAQQETPDPAIVHEPQARKQARSRELLKAALALPAEMPFARGEDDQEEPAAKAENGEAKPLPSDKGAAQTKTQAPILAATTLLAPTPVAEAPTPERKSEPAAQAKPLPAPAVLPAETHGASPHAPAPQGPVLAGTTGGGSWFALGVMLLVGAVGGMLVLTRRRGRREGLIRILETAAIGPKRTLLVARVNGRTMVLGASEAGIALLESIEGKESTPVAQVMGEPPAVRERIEEPLALPAEAASETDGEVGMLSRLFRRRPKLVSDKDEAAFRDLLAESYEDQELRERLSRGLVAKVS